MKYNPMNLTLDSVSIEDHNIKGEKKMIKRTICSQCGAECEYDTSSKGEGNREREEFVCPDCGCVLDVVFTDRLPNVRVINHGNTNRMLPQEKT